MLNKHKYLLVAALNLCAVAGSAQERPLSVIDWLDKQPVAQPVAVLPKEPDVAKTGAVATVTVAPLGGTVTRAIGLVPASVTGLPDTLWQNGEARALARQISEMPTQRLPAAQSLFYTLLLAEAPSPNGTANPFQLARVDALIAQGALEPALAMLEQIGPNSGPATMARYFDASLLTESEEAPCAAIVDAPHLAPNYSARVFCTARAGDWETATLLLGTARALDVIPATHAAALERFLDPDLFEDAAPLPRLSTPNALMFRVYEALGQPVSTKTWPRAYANADLRDVAGWKPQLEAAERLATTGALPDNRLLGIYSARRPAASGGIWDRVAAVQRLETAIRVNSAEAVSKTLPAAWNQMKAANLAVPFATLFAVKVAKFDLTGSAQTARFHMAFLSADYETAASPNAQKHAFLTGLAKGAPPQGNTDRERAIAQSFGPPTLSEPFQQTLDDKSQALGGVLLSVLAQLQDGADGDLGQLTTALGNLRALGLEDTARRAALQLLLLETG